MSYIVVGVVVLVLASTLLAFKPNARHKRLLLLRRHANSRGLHVEIVADAIDDGRGRQPTAVRYLLPWTARNICDDTQRHWLLVRNERRGRSSPWQGWHWYQQEAPEQHHAAIGEGLKQFPDSVSALCSNSFGLGAYWPERGKSEDVDKIAGALRSISNKFR